MWAHIYKCYVSAHKRSKKILTPDIIFKELLRVITLPAVFIVEVTLSDKLHLITKAIINSLNSFLFQRLCVKIREFYSIFLRSLAEESIIKCLYFSKGFPFLNPVLTPINFRSSFPAAIASYTLSPRTNI